MLKYQRFYDTQELLNLYALYYASPSIVHWKALFNAILHYRFDDYALFVTKSAELQHVAAFDDNMILTSNNKTSYPLGPNPRQVLNDVESFLRLNPFPTKNKVLFVEDEIKGLKLTRYLTGTDSFKVLCVPDLKKHQALIESYSSDHVVMGHARALNQLQELNASFVNTDGAAFIKTDRYINDQMIDWRSGLNFWTCIKGHKHFLPIFSHHKNLLNLNKTITQDSDWFKPTSDFVKCRCGLMRCDFDFVPHYRLFIENQNYNELLLLANKLQGTYRWIQFVQKARELHVYFSGDMQDKSIIEKQFSMPVALVENQYFVVGSKLPVFWKVPC